MKLFDKTLTVLEKALDVRLTRQNVLAGNIANVDTAGFQPKDIDFRAAMDSAMREDTSFEGASNGSTASSFTVTQESGAGLDGNGVDLDRAMVAMAENAIQYGAAARGASKKLAILRYVASDGNA